MHQEHLEQAATELDTLVRALQADIRRLNHVGPENDLQMAVALSCDRLADRVRRWKARGITLVAAFGETGQQLIDGIRELATSYRKYNPHNGSPLSRARRSILSLHAEMEASIGT